MTPRHWLLHLFFKSGLTLKALFGAFEGLAGLGLLLVPSAGIHRLLGWLTHYEIAENPTDRLANFVLGLGARLPIAEQHFYGAYLTFHGALKLTIMLFLWRRVPRAYPLAMVVLGLFAAYEISEFFRAGSPFLAALAAFDLFMVGLIWQEYRVLIQGRQGSGQQS